jgi:hypothetical protein
LENIQVVPRENPLTFILSWDGETVDFLVQINKYADYCRNLWECENPCSKNLVYAMANIGSMPNLVRTIMPGVTGR